MLTGRARVHERCFVLRRLAFVCRVFAVAVTRACLCDGSARLVTQQRTCSLLCVSASQEEKYPRRCVFARTSGLRLCAFDPFYV